jgi:hypothetical protein
MDFNTIVSFMGATLGAGFFMLFGYAFSISGESVFYSMLIAFAVFYVSVTVFLRIFLKEEKRNLSFLEKRVRFPYQWLILLAEISWLSLCVLSIGYIGNRFFGTPILNITIISLVVIIFANMFKQTLSLERLMVTLVALSFFMILFYHTPAIGFFVPTADWNIFLTIPLVFVFFVGSERVISTIPGLGKKDRSKATFLTIFTALLLYVIMFFLFPRPEASVYFVSNYFPYPFNFLIMVPISLIFLSSANASVDICVDMVRELSERSFLPNFFKDRKEYTAALLVLVISLILAMSRDLISLAYLANISYITFFLLISIYGVMEKGQKKGLPLLSAILLFSMYVFIPSYVIVMFILVLPLMVFLGDIIKGSIVRSYPAHH